MMGRRKSDTIQGRLVLVAFAVNLLVVAASGYELWRFFTLLNRVQGF